jgi:hypothetical protein
VLSGKGSLRQGCEFLGHRLVLRQDHLTTTPSGLNEQDLMAHAERLDVRLGKALYPPPGMPVDKQKVIECLTELLALITGWQAAFCECDDPERYLVPLQCELDEGLEAVRLSVEQIKPLVEPSMVYRPGNYAFGH